MADIKISQLGAAIAVSGSDLLPIVSNGSTLKAPASLVKEYAVGNTDLSGIGDGTPTGAISALNTAKQPKTLDTPLTIGDVQKTTVEAALGGLNSESQSLRQALANVEDDLTPIRQSSASGCTTDINRGAYFYLDDVLVRAKTRITNGTDFSDQNYDVVTVGALNELGQTIFKKQNAGNLSDIFTKDTTYVASMASSSWVGKRGNVVSLYLSVELGATVNNNMTPIGTLAVGYRPIDIAYFPVVKFGTGYTSSYATARITDNGEIGIYGATANASYGVFITFFIE